MAIRGATKRKRIGTDGGQEPIGIDSEKKLKSKLIASVGNGRGKRGKGLEGDGAENDEDGEGENEGTETDDDNDDDNYEDNHSQKRRMVLFEKRLREIKKQKKSTSENGAIKFKKKVKLQEEALIDSLQAQETQIKANASGFSKVLTTLFHNAFNSSPSVFLAESSIGLPELIQNHQFHAPQASITALSTKLIASSQSLQSILAAIADREFVLGEGWERDGDLSISALRQAQQTALVKLTEMISKDGDTNIAGTKGGVEVVAWRGTAKRSAKGIASLLKYLPVPTADEGNDEVLDKMGLWNTDYISS